MTLNIERAETGSLSPDILAEVRSLCNEAYGEDLTGYFADIGPGVHLLGWHDSTLVSHLMWVLRTLYPAGAEPLQCAYVELVATRVSEQRRGFATRLMRRVAKEIRSHALGALSPSDHSFYERLGWEQWRGPLLVRTSAGLEATPEESIMVLRLPSSPVLDLAAPLAIDWRPGEVW